jgi:hypothetical protein
MKLLISRSPHLGVGEGADGPNDELNEKVGKHCTLIMALNGQAERGEENIAIAVALSGGLFPAFSNFVRRGRV